MHELDIAQHSILQPEASVEYLKSHSAKLMAGDTTKDIDLFGSALKDAKINYGKEKIGAEQQQAAQRYDSGMDSADKEVWVGENNLSSMKAELAQTGSAIKDIMNAIEHKKNKEDDIKNDAKARDDETSTATQNLDKAVDSFNQIQSACGIEDQNPSQSTTQSQGSHDESSSHPRFELLAKMDSSHHWPI